MSLDNCKRVLGMEASIENDRRLCRSEVASPQKAVPQPFFYLDVLVVNRCGVKLCRLRIRMVVQSGEQSEG